MFMATLFIIALKWKQQYDVIAKQLFLEKIARQRNYIGCHEILENADQSTATESSPDVSWR